jgi:NADH dehydrogenase
VPPASSPLRVVVLGGGFGGVYTARRLLAKAHRGEVEVTVVSRSASFLFTPLLHEVATGGLSAPSVAVPLRQAFRGTGARVIVGEAVSVDEADKSVRVRCAEGSEAEFGYDVLVVALGAQATFFGVPGAAEGAYTLKTIEDARAIRGAIVATYERAARLGESPSFAVVGAGPTGVELAAELAELCSRTLGPAYPEAAPARVSLVSSGPDILPMLKPKGRAKALEALHDEGVEVFLGATVEAVERGLVRVKGGDAIPADMTLWAAGVVPAPLPAGLSLALDEKSRAKVGPALAAEGHPHVYVLGDQASGSPMLAQAATQQAHVVADAILAARRGQPTRAFRFKPKGLLVSLGRWRAVGEIGPVTISGPVAWWIWRTVYLFKFPSLWKRVRVAADWTIGLFFPRDLSV